MNRQRYHQSIKDLLLAHSEELKNNSRLNLQDAHIYSESFIAGLLNRIYDRQFENINEKVRNTPGIDLIDESNKLIAQVSTTSTKQKIQDSLNKIECNKYTEHTFFFIAMTYNKNKLKEPSFDVSDNIIFDPKEHILNYSDFVNYLFFKPTDKLQEVHEYLTEELKLPTRNQTTPNFSNLAKIVNMLSKESLEPPTDSPESQDFKIEDKIFFNNLETVRDIIQDHALYTNALDQIYSTADQEGKNTSFSVLQTLRNMYTQFKQNHNSEGVFHSIIEEVSRRILDSTNYDEISREERDICINIIVVDAFMRCKIFENPQEPTHAAT